VKAFFGAPLSGFEALSLLPEGLFSAVCPGAIVGFAADAVLAHLSEDLAGGGKAVWVDVFLRVPQIGADDGPGALKIDGFDGDDDDGAWGFAIDSEGGEQVGVGGELGAAVDAKGVADAGDQEHESDVWVADDVAQGIDAIVAASVGQHESFFVVDADEAGDVTARGAVESLGAAGGKCREGCGIDEGAVLRCDTVGDFEGGSLCGQTVDGFQI
jgi:hypothetical protein